MRLHHCADSINCKQNVGLDALIVVYYHHPNTINCQIICKSRYFEEPFMISKLCLRNPKAQFSYLTVAYCLYIDSQKPVYVQLLVFTIIFLSSIKKKTMLQMLLDFLVIRPRLSMNKLHLLFVNYGDFVPARKRLSINMKEKTNSCNVLIFVQPVCFLQTNSQG